MNGRLKTWKFIQSSGGKSDKTVTWFPFQGAMIAEESGRQSSHPLLSSKSNPPRSSPALWQTTCHGHSCFSAPIPRGLCRSWWYTLLYSLLWEPCNPPLPIPVSKCQLQMPRNTFYQGPLVVTPGRISKTFPTRQLMATTFP